MTSIALDAYSVMVREKRGTEPLTLGMFKEKEALRDVVREILAAYEDRHEDFPGYKKCLKAKEISTSGSLISGRLWAGPYGTRSPLVDASTGETNYEQQSTDARLEPFFFIFFLPKNYKQGILLSQRTGLGGVKTLLYQLISREFRKSHPEYVLTMLPMMPQQAIEALMKKSQLAEIRFIQSEISSDVAEKFNENKQPQDGEMEIILRPKRKGYLNMGGLLGLFSGQRKASDFLTMEDFEPDNVKAEIILASGRRRVIDFGQPERIRASFDITRDIVLGEDSHPELGSISQVGEELVVEIAAQMGITE